MALLCRRRPRGLIQRTLVDQLEMSTGIHSASVQSRDSGVRGRSTVLALGALALVLCRSREKSLISVHDPAWFCASRLGVVCLPQVPPGAPRAPRRKAPGLLAWEQVTPERPSPGADGFRLHWGEH